MESFMQNFLGAWRLVSFEEAQPDGHISHPYGERPAGLLIYDASGHMSVQIMRRDRPQTSSDPNNISADELNSVLEGFTAFFGTYEIDEAERTIIHHVEGHLLPSSVGKSLRRSFEFSGDRLILKPTESRRVTWERIK